MASRIFTSARVLIAALVGFMLFLPLQTGADERKFVRVGVLTDLTGKAAYLGQQTRIGAEIAADEINASGNASGKRLALAFGDHALDTTRAVTEAQKMLSAQHVDAIFSNFSGPSRAAAAVVQHAGRLFVYSAAAVSPVKDNRNAFKSYLDYVKGCESIARHWKTNRLSPVGLMKAESEFGELCEMGAKIVFPDLLVTPYKVGEDVSTPAIILKGKQVAAVLNATYEGDMDNMLKAFAKLAFTPKIGANEDVFTVKVIAQHAAALEQAISFGMPQPDKEFCAKVSLRDVKHETRGCDHAGMAYLHIKQIYAAIESCGDKGVDCQASALLGSPADPRFGFIRWQDNHQALFDDSLRSLVNGTFQPVGD